MERSLRHLSFALLCSATGCLAGCATPSTETDRATPTDAPSEKPPADRERSPPPVLPGDDLDTPVSDCDALAPDSPSASTENDAKDPPFRATGNVAAIDGTPVSAERFHRYVARVLRRSDTSTGAGGLESPDAQWVGWSAPDRAGRLRNAAYADEAARHLELELLQSLADTVAIERYVEERAAPVAPAELREALRSFRRRLSSGAQHRSLDSFLESRSLSRAELAAELCRERKLRAILRDEYDIDVSERRLRTYYEQHAGRFERPEQVRVRHILVRLPHGAPRRAVSEARERARGLLERARGSDAPFDDLAREHSDAPSAERGGDLGYITRTQMGEEFKAAAFGAEPGTIVGPVRSRFGFHVIQVRDRRPARRHPFEEVRDEIRAHLERRALQNALDQLRAKIRAERDIELHADRIVRTADSYGTDSSPSKTDDGTRAEESSPNFDIATPDDAENDLQKRKEIEKSQSEANESGGARSP